MKRIITMGFDPGHRDGAMAWTDGDGKTQAITTRDHFDEHESWLPVFRKIRPTIVAIENLPLVCSTNAALLMISFGRIIEAAHSWVDYSPDCSVVMVTPARWQRFHKFPAESTYANRKDYAWQMAKDKFGDRVLKTQADALLINDWIQSFTQSQVTGI